MDVVRHCASACNHCSMVWGVVIVLVIVGSVANVVLAWIVSRVVVLYQ